MSPFPLGILAASGAGVEAGSYDLLETTILGSSQSSVSFTGLDSYTDYKHLQIRAVSRVDGGNTQDSLILTFNGVGGTSYSSHFLEGSLGNVTSGNFTSRADIVLPTTSSGSSAANSFGAMVIDILDPFETTKNTTTRTLGGMTDRDYITLWSGLFMNTAAITSLNIAPFSASNFITGTRFSLYGIGTPELAGA